MRIVRKRVKLLFFLGWILVTVVLSRIDLLLPNVARLIVPEVVFVAVVAVAVRSFRGRTEAIAPPRAPWRMTGGVTSGLVLAAFFLLGGVISVLEIAQIYPHSATNDPWRTASCCVDAVSWSVMTALFVNSSVRLRRLPPESPRDEGSVVAAAV